MLLRTIAFCAVALALPAGEAFAAPSASSARATPLAHARPADDAAAISRGLKKAVSAGRLSRAEAREYRAIVGTSRAVMSRIPAQRRRVLARVLRQVRAQANVYNRPRALALFTMLHENSTLLARRGLPPSETDYVGRHGIVYRAGWGSGLQFHPLANVIALNAHMYANRLGKAASLAGALAARAVPTANGGAVWEYYFDYGGGRAPWTSGMAQAIGAQAFARAGRRLTAPDLFTVADAAYKSMAPLVRPLSNGPWVRLYSFNNLVVLNAQLQAILSLLDYGKIVNNPQAIGLADRMENAARDMLPSFDTGAWTNYVPHREAPLKYHLYHVELAMFLGRRTGADVWQGAHGRFDRYSREPPKFRRGKQGPSLYPWPRDGFRDARTISLWVSKISTVTVTVGGRRYALGVRRRGWHSVAWSPGRVAARVYRPAVTAVDLAANRGSATLAPVRVEIDREPPDVRANVVGRRLTWRATDPTTPWIRLHAVVRRGDAKRRLELGRRPLSGSLKLPVPRGTWDAVLFASDSSGNRTKLPLGPVPARG